MRQPRQLTDGARYHVTARANNRAMIFYSRWAKELLLRVIAQAKRRYHFRIENFCVMSNHVHFIIYPENGSSLSAIMRWILGVFATQYNKRTNATGHVWGERFYSKAIEGIQNFLRVMRYIDDNPSAASIAAKGGDWSFCGLAHQRQGRFDVVDAPPSWLQLLVTDRSPLSL